MTHSTTHSLDAEELKACCAAAYEGAWAQVLLGESFHPGGLTLTHRLGTLMGLGPASVVLDVACGRGASALALARAFGCQVIGVDLSASNIEAARAAAAAVSLDHLVTFRVGDGEALQIETAAVDAVTCECAFCTFPDKLTAAREFARVLRPGGVLGLTDLTRDGTLPEAFDSLLAWAACVADARPLRDYVRYLAGAGLRVERQEVHNDALHDLVRQVGMKLMAAEVATKLGRISLPLDQLTQAKLLLGVASQAVQDGRLGYALVVARRNVDTGERRSGA